MCTFCVLIAGFVSVYTSDTLPYSIEDVLLYRVVPSCIGETWRIACIYQRIHANGSMEKDAST